ncbi:chaplin [Streptomyces sp. NPDC056683]|uniref:chaplin n=1 Tax=Streptomyces sp. NPDC056683 TaxID=3345910 RepID=UPI00368231E0
MTTLDGTLLHKVTGTDDEAYRRVTWDAREHSAQGGAMGSLGVLSGNAIQVPMNIPVNACGNTVDVIGLLNTALGQRRRLHGLARRHVTRQGAVRGA